MKKRMAADSYKTATCSALMGVYLFRDGAGVDRRTCQPGEPLQVNLGDREWVVCPQGLPDVFRLLEETDMGGRLADLPDDWGVIANQAGEVLYRAGTPDSIRSVHYLGRDGGELATGPATIAEMRMSPRAGEAPQYWNAEGITSNPPQTPAITTKRVTYESVWDEGTVTTSAKLNLLSGEVTDIETDDGESAEYEHQISDPVSGVSAIVEANDSNAYFLKDLSLLVQFGGAEIHVPPRERG